MVVVMVKWWEAIGSDKKCGNRLKLLMKFYEMRGEKKREFGSKTLELSN